MSSTDESGLTGGFGIGLVDPALADEFPNLGLRWVEVEARSRRSPPALRQRLRDHADRLRGDRAVALRHQAIPAAYRIFFRQIGLDPDTHRIPAEEAVIGRLIAGGFPSRGLPEDARTLAVMETGVAVWLLDAATVDGGMVLRPAVEGERLGCGDEARALPQGRLVVADQRGPVAVLFSEVAPAHAVTRATRRMTAFSVVVDGVPMIAVEEALWTCIDVLAS